MPRLLLMLRTAPTMVAPLCAPRDVYVPGAEAHWTKCRYGSRTTVSGWLKDTRADGKCAQVYAFFTNGAYRESSKACPAGTTKSFYWDVPANDASIYLRTIG